MAEKYKTSKYGRTVLDFKRLIHAVRIRQFKLKLFRCPLCGISILVRLNDNELSIRCLRCRATVIIMSLVTILIKKYPNFNTKTIYELSCRGPLYTFLKKQPTTLFCSEFFDDIPCGEFKGDIQCQDVQELTYSDDLFDICTSTEVFEHVPDDIKGFSELHRVLKKGGYLFFTVPVNLHENTVERAKEHNMGIEHLLPPVYHGDHLRGENRVLCYRDYGKDITSRLHQAGFSSTTIVFPDTFWFSFNWPVILAIK